MRRWLVVVLTAISRLQLACPLLTGLVRVVVAQQPQMLLVLGARDAHALPARHGTEPLVFLGRAVAAAIAR